MFVNITLPIKYQQWQTNPGNDPPSQESIKPQLNLLSDPIVRHECVEDPQGDVGKQQEGDELSTRFDVLLHSSGADAARGLRDYHA